MRTIASKCFLGFLVSFLVLVGPALASDCVPAPSGIIAWWPGESDASDIVGGMNGTIYGDVTIAPGLVGNAFSFSGQGGNVTIPDNPALSPGIADFTVEWWMKTEVTDLSSVMNKRITCYHESFWSFRINGNRNGGIVCELDQNSQGTNYINILGPPIADNNWHHIAIVRQGVVASIYCDGQYATSDSSIAVTDIYNSASLQFGSGPCVGPLDGTHPYAGLLDEITIYSRALSASEIESLALAGEQGKCITNPTPVEYSQSIGSLLTVFPNPCSGSQLSFSLELPRLERAQVSIFDMRGRRVGAVLDAELDSGRHSFTWMPRVTSELPSGIYLVQLRVGGHHENHRLVVLK